MPNAPTVYAIDFGTSNSLLAAANADQIFAPIPLDPDAADPTILRSIIYFPDAERAYVGEAALARYVENGLEGRLLRSLKRHLPARSFRGTYIGARPMQVEDLVAVILREMRNRANAHYGVDVKRAVLGRPARFAADDLDDDFAERRLRSAAERAGFEEIHFLPEPVAAAREFRAAFSGEASGCVLVCDFGGGTSDFTVMRLGEQAFVRSDVLAIGGVPVAGDALDAGIMRSHVAKNFGADVAYRVPMGSNVLRMPPQITEQLCSPAHLSILRRPDIAEFLRNVRSWALDGSERDKLDQLKTLVDDALGFQLFEVIERAKRTLSSDDVAAVDFVYPSIDVHERVTRDGFEAACEKATSTILGCLDATVEQAGIGREGIDVVCCTGGTAKVPKLARELGARFGEEKLRDFRSFHSVVQGLAHHAMGVARAES
jgi:hypothetical chaperone protein